jgi:pimeloyl-ACP methyl ester carboxylesterase
MTWGGTYPERVDRLVLASTAPRFTDVIRGLRQERVASHHGQPYFEDAIAALQVATIPGADHFVFLEPESRSPWSRAVLDFLAGGAH